MLFAVLLFGSMLISVLVNLGDVLTGLCTTADCREVRSLTPWLTGLAMVLLVLVLCRLFGPVFVTPAAGTWLASTPVDRAALLRPRLVVLLLLAAAAGLPTVAAGMLGGLGVGDTVLLTVLTAVLGVVAAAAAALAQARERPWLRMVTWSLAGLLWVLLLLLATGRGNALRAPTGVTGWVLLMLAVVISAGLLVGAVRSLSGLRRRDIAPGGALAPGLSGALAMLDFALLYDVLLAHRARRLSSVRSRRGGPSGPISLVWADVTRIRRSPGPPAILAGVVVLPYLAATAGAGPVVVPIAGLAGFLATLPLLSGLRVLSRTPGMTRNLPWDAALARRLALCVPAVTLGLFGLACSPAIGRAADLPIDTAVCAGLTVGLAALASAVRWVTGRPPDYGRPLVSTPAGGVPTNLYGSAFRGFDILLLTTVPLLLFEPTTGVLVSIGISAVTLAYLTGRKLN